MLLELVTKIVKMSILVLSYCVVSIGLKYHAVLDN